MKNVLILASLLIVAAGIWLGVMENIFKHDGYAGRSVIAACIAIEGSATVLFLVLNGGSAFRNLIMSGAVGMMVLGASAILKSLRAQHFEGFVLLIGLALVLQGALTLVTLGDTRYRHVA